MKKTYYFLIGLCIILFSSCSHTNNFEIFAKQFFTDSDFQQEHLAPQINVVSFADEAHTFYDTKTHDSKDFQFIEYNKNKMILTVNADSNIAYIESISSGFKMSYYFKKASDEWVLYQLKEVDNPYNLATDSI